MHDTAKPTQTLHRQQSSEHDIEMQNWNEEQGRIIARTEAVELTEAHWDVIRYLREYYHRHDSVRSGRELGNMLANAFADLGGRKYLHRLFPDGPVAQGLRISGLPVPPHTEDAGFGTSR